MHHIPNLRRGQLSLEGRHRGASYAGHDRFKEVLAVMAQLDSTMSSSRQGEVGRPDRMAPHVLKASRQQAITPPFRPMTHHTDRFAMKTGFPVLDGGRCHRRLGRDRDGLAYLFLLPAARERLDVLDDGQPFMLGDLLPAWHRSPPQSVSHRQEEIGIGGKRILPRCGPEFKNPPRKISRTWV